MKSNEEVFRRNLNRLQHMVIRAIRESQQYNWNWVRAGEFEEQLTRVRYHFGKQLKDVIGYLESSDTRTYHEMLPIVDMLFLGTSFNGVLDWPEAYYVLSDYFFCLFGVLEKRGGHISRIEMWRDTLAKTCTNFDAQKKAENLRKIRDIDL